MTIRILQGDCREVMATLPEASIEAIVTDPPYHLTAEKKGGSGPASVNLNTPHGRARVTTGFMGMTWDGGDVAMRVETWAAALRVLKPGGYLLAFSGTRTYHRMVCAIEDAGFEIRDQIGWVYGSGFPKSLDVSKAIDKAAGAEREVTREGQTKAPEDAGKFDSACSSLRERRDAPATDAARQWQGWGTALKPAWEPIVVARKPLIGTVAENVLTHGTGALNIDGCRVPGENPSVARREQAAATGWDNRGGGIMADRTSPERYAEARAGELLGRWPANLIHDGSDEVVAMFPSVKAGGNVKGTEPSSVTAGIYGEFDGRVPFAGYADTGSAARFFYSAKADAADRNEGLPHGQRNTHPTVKPTDLMRYLCRLVTPPDGTVLDPFAGSGSTLKAAELEGFAAIGIELSPEYIAIARHRIAGDAPLFAEVHA